MAVRLDIRYILMGIILLAFVLWLFGTIQSTSFVSKAETQKDLDTKTHSTAKTNNDMREIRAQLTASNIKQEEQKIDCIKTEAELKKQIDQKSLENTKLKEQLKHKRTPIPFVGLKIVHLDLKGAPPKMDYLIKFLKLAKRYGANGFLMEYEDMFPWKDDLSILARKNAYTEEDIQLIVKTAEKENMILIPLIQTFGHLEFVLKHKKFSYLRAKEEISPLHNESIPLVKKMIDQVIALHPKSKYVHIGGDEVWVIETCKQCIAIKMNVFELYTHHMMPLLRHVNAQLNKNGEKRQSIIWDDMMRYWTEKQLKSMANLALPMIWGYVADLETYFPTDMWQKYSKAFPKVWIASSFKGALKPWSDFVPIKQHLDNHLSWLKIARNLKKNNVQVTGIGLTGWSRFDHYGPLCELLPVSIPSFSLCLAVLQRGTFNERIHKNVSGMLGFKSPVKITIPNSIRYEAESASFNGADVYHLIGERRKAIGWLEMAQEMHDGWTRPFYLKKNLLSFHALDNSLDGMYRSIAQLNGTRQKAQLILKRYYGKEVVREWIADKIDYSITQAKSLIFRMKEIILKKNK